ncbi:pilus assembly protein [Roseateles sp.]|uniref:pilus assembly protein n=1 Tax=Roseateles sp. TaxID=1971397 RepID=UPI002E0ADA81|nr:pilus assembly protein [Roseateles sp.]
MKIPALRRKAMLGQGMTEYIIIVALIAIAAIGVYNLYGRTLRHQTAAMAAAVGGDAQDAQDSNKSGTTAGQMATKEASAKIGLENFSEPAATK